MFAPMLLTFSLLTSGYVLGFNTNRELGSTEEHVDELRSPFCGDFDFKDVDIEEILKCLNLDKNLEDFGPCYENAFGGELFAEEKRKVVCSQTAFEQIYLEVTKCYYDKNEEEKEEIEKLMGLMRGSLTIEDMLKTSEGIEVFGRKKDKLKCIRDVLDMSEH